MRIVLLISLLFFGLAGFAQTFELYNGDTINFTDKNGQKQGNWKIFDKAKTKVMDEGKYVNDKKEGAWKKYYESGKVKSELTYVTNKADGYAKFYYENGNLSEEGVWRNNKWVGDYKYYYENGKPSYVWSYNEQGKRSGTQKYFHPNGNVMIEGDWQDGKESGVIKEFDENGKLVSEKSFLNGQMDPASVKVYKPEVTDNNTKEVVTNNDQKVVDNKDNKDNKDTKDTKVVQNNNNSNNALDVFNGNGYNKLFKNGRLDQEGEFKNGVLLNGKRFSYSADGKLEKTTIYKDGKAVETVLPDKKKK